MSRPPRRQRLDKAPGMPADPREVAAARWRAIQAASVDPDLTPLDVRGLAYIVACRMNLATGLAFPSGETAAKDLGIARRTWIRITANLSERGYITLLQVPGRSNRYTLAWQRFIAWAVTSGAQPDETGAAAELAGHGESQACASAGTSPVPGETHTNKAPVNLHESTSPIARLREVVGDGKGEGVVADAAAAQAGQQDDERSVDRQPANDRLPPAMSEVEARRRRNAEMAKRYGAWGWWSGCGLATPPPDEAFEVNPEFAEAVHAFDRGASTWSIREVGAARFVDRSAGSRPTHAEVTAFAEALAAGKADAAGLMAHFREIAAVEAEVEARHMAARAEARAVGDSGELMMALFAEDPGLRQAAEARAATLAASWARRIAAEPIRLAALPPAASMSNTDLIEACRIVCGVRGWNAADLARAVGLPAHALEAFLDGGFQRINPAGHARLRPFIAERQAARAAA